MEKFLRDYIRHLKMSSNYRSMNLPCEICGCAEYTTIREIISIGKDKFGKLPVVACNRCGFLYQTPRLNKKFYNDYYGKNYRNVLEGSFLPSEDFIADQIKRGKNLYKTIKKYIPKSGNLLDVGCSVGATMIPFLRKGWKAYGTDPDKGFASYGRDKLGLPVDAVGAERMNLNGKRFDFIMILGSLEHVYDPNVTLRICRRVSSENGYLLLEGRGHPQKESKTYFNHNHHRYFTLNSIGLMMIKHGWEPVLTTDQPLCGQTRVGAIYCLGKVAGIPARKDFLRLIDSGKRETPAEILEEFDKLDKTKRK